MSLIAYISGQKITMRTRVFRKHMESRSSVSPRKYQIFVIIYLFKY